MIYTYFQKIEEEFSGAPWTGGPGTSAPNVPAKTLPWSMALDKPRKIPMENSRFSKDWVV